MKTPEQIATETIARNYWDGTGYAEPGEEGIEGLTIGIENGDVDADGVRAMIIAAIETDRAQRAVFADEQPTNDAILTGEW